jgi:hypothetical protein
MGKTSNGQFDNGGNGHPFGKAIGSPRWVWSTGIPGGIMDTTATAPNRLGRLQKVILALALRNREAEDRHGEEDYGADVLATEAIVAHLELPDAEAFFRDGRTYSTTIYGSARLSKAEYLSAKASVSVSLRILERRGLVVAVRGLTGWTGANLTEEGVRVAQSLQGIEATAQIAAS